MLSAWHLSLRIVSRRFLWLALTVSATGTPALIAQKAQLISLSPHLFGCCCRYGHQGKAYALLLLCHRCMPFCFTVSSCMPYLCELHADFLQMLLPGKNKDARRLVEWVEHGMTSLFL